LPGIDDYVAFSFGWPNDSQDDPPCVQLYLPVEDRFPDRNQLLARIRPQLAQTGFTDQYNGEEDPLPDYPLWKYIPLNFGGQTVIDLPRILSEVVKGFQGLMEVEPTIDEAIRSTCPPPPRCKRDLKTVAFVDTEWTGEEPARKMTELAIVNVAYDPVGDEVVGVVGKYSWRKGQKLKKPEAVALLKNAHRIVAHNCSGDQSLVAQHLSGIKTIKWLCSYRGVEWKRLLRVQSASQSSLLGKAGLRIRQDHHAKADAQDLIWLLAQKHQGGRTYLGRLLEKDEQAG